MIIQTPIISKSTTPSTINSDVHKLCNKIKDINDPIFVNVKPRQDSITNDCYIDVEKQIKEHGGEIQYGWIIWIWDNFYAEATFHAVWKKPNGQLLDVSYKQDGEKKILFAADNNRKFNNAQIPSVRISLCTDPRVNKWINLMKELEDEKELLTSQSDFESGFEPTENLINLFGQSQLLFDEILQDFNYFR